MKTVLKIFSLAILLSIAISAFAVRPPIPEISVSPQSVSFSAGGGSKSVSVTAENMTWSIVTAPATWVTATKTASGVQIRVSKNSSTSSRSTSITLGQGKTTCEVTISQDGASAPKPTTPTPTLQVSETNIVADSQGENRYLKVDAKGANWNVLDYPDVWVGISGKTADGLLLRIDPNQSGNSRSATMTIGYGKVKTTVRIEQKGSNGNNFAQYCDLSQEQIETLKSRAKDKLESFQYFLQTMADNRNSMEVRKNAHDSSINLFIGECEPYETYDDWTGSAVKNKAVRMQTSSVNRSGTREQTMKQYLARMLKGLGYANVRIEQCDAIRVDNIRKVADGKYMAVGYIVQKFVGYGENGGVIYSDITGKKVFINIDMREVPTDEGLEEIWDVKLGDMYVIATRRN